MLHHVDVRNTKIGAGLLSLNLGDPANGFTVKGIEGLDPVKATLVSSSFANMDGEQYHTSRRETRDIRIILGLKHKTLSVEQLREQLYSVFMPKSEVALSFYKTDGSYLNISGVVETCEAPLFTKEPGMVIIVRCFDSDFVAPVPGTVSAAVVQGTNPVTFTYAGTVPTGITFTLSANAVVPSVVLCMAPQGFPERYLTFNTQLNSGDVLTIATTKGSRSATLKRSGGVALPALYGVSYDSTWLEVQPGVNTFRAYSPASNAPYTLSWLIKHGGL